MVEIREWHPRWPYNTFLTRCLIVDLANTTESSVGANVFGCIAAITTRALC